MGSDNLKKVWPEWKIVEMMGEGSYGKVFKAVREDHGISSYSAIKVITIPQNDAETESLRMEGLNDTATRTYFEEIVKDFVSEIKLMESLKGTPNIVSVEDYKVVEKKDKIGWDIYIRMELLTSFNDYACDKKLTEKDVIKLGSDICSALELCAQRGIIHRDIKPENIFISDFGYFKLGDFGIARQIEKTMSALSRRGTLNYMAPEVSNGSDYDSRADIYSLGIVLYKLLNNNRIPFLDPYKQLIQYKDRVNAVEKRMNGDALPPPAQASTELAAVILKACAFKQEDRFKDPKQFRTALASLKSTAESTLPSEKNEYISPAIDDAEIDDKTESLLGIPKIPEETEPPRLSTDSLDNNPAEVQAEHAGANNQVQPQKRMIWIAFLVMALLIALAAGIYTLPKYFADRNNSDDTTLTISSMIISTTANIQTTVPLTTALLTTEKANVPTTAPAIILATSAPKVPDNILSKNTKPGDSVEFGNYNQGNKNGYTLEKIKWRVLAVDIQNRKVLLLSNRILDAKPYNNVEKVVTWENCFLRKWLNEDFYNNSFSSAEKNSIASSNLVNDDGSNTEDKVFLLSYSEATNTGYGFASTQNSDTAREANGTNFAISNGLVYTDLNTEYDGNSSWWLRSNNASVVFDSGFIGENLVGGVSDATIGVRPACWVNLPS